jgi:hypothetical protein
LTKIEVQKQQNSAYLRCKSETSDRSLNMDKLLEEAVFSACLKSAVAMGDKIYGLSWFGKNQNLASYASSEEKTAA